MLTNDAPPGAGIVACARCPELREYCAAVARERKREYRDLAYWGQPVPSFGSFDARIALVGLAPGAHGSNRTGRHFTGDASGVWLYRALFRAGLASTPVARSRDDGLELRGVFITAALRCAPPGNKPAPRQLANCRGHLEAEFAALARLRVAVGLGRIGSKAAWDALRARGWEPEHRMFVFAHGRETRFLRGESAVVLLCSYHPSRQNTNTGVLTEAMLDAIFTRAAGLAPESTRPA
jgi:uracil-DNA glycosylase family 4